MDGISAPTTFLTTPQRLTVGDMFAGYEKEYVFKLLPGEKKLDELTIRHQHLFFITSGVTRVTLTTQRLLYTTTRVFSPIYWLLLVLFPPLIYYYVFRVSRNRNVAMPLGNVDSIEKRYRPHWLLFILAIVAVNVVAWICVSMIPSMPNQLRDDAPVLRVMAQGLVLGIGGPAVLILLLATRLARFDILSRGGISCPIWYSTGDAAISEERFDAFFQNVYAQTDRVRAARPRLHPASL